MSQSAKFFYVQVKQLNDADAFYTNCLGMLTESTIISKEKAILVKVDGKTNIFLSEHKHQNQTNKIVLTSDDCLEDYCRLRSRGVVFKNRPAYLGEGLSIEFSDPYGNDFIILEQRNYNED
ncbi:VOC family protein [Pedobacter psychrodurus]|uniref:VOC family protein n=1 Tax=Pedobacter psychrodurus TaxID=2530456 RepID=UPI0029308088|nr:VOC family protein [Pedobacter psychrodurus]